MHPLTKSLQGRCPGRCYRLDRRCRRTWKGLCCYSLISLMMLLTVFKHSESFTPFPAGAAGSRRKQLGGPGGFGGLLISRYLLSKTAALEAPKTCTTSHRRRLRIPFARQQTLDMGLLPPDRKPTLEPRDQTELEQEHQGDEQVDEDTAGAVGLIGHFEATELLSQRGKEGLFWGSLDMSMSTRELISMAEGIALPNQGDVDPCLVASWEELEVVIKKAKKGQYGCWELYGDGCTAPCKVSDMSGSTNRPAMLCAPVRAPGPPTMVLGGFAMHRISGGDQNSNMEPGMDTDLKVAASGARRASGRVLDTCTGLGYTAIAAARCKGVTGVVTVELDEVSLRMCARNPWSRAMFKDDKIVSLQGDCCELVKDFKDGEFAAVIHDPPARALCKTTDMYGSAFYKDLARVLKSGGTLFHYVGNPSSTEGGRLFRGVISRLIEAGFHDCKTDRKAFGVVARR